MVQCIQIKMMQLHKKKIWNKKELDAWRKNLLGKTWEIYWEPSQDDDDDGLEKKEVEGDDNYANDDNGSTCSNDVERNIDKEKSEKRKRRIITPSYDSSDDSEGLEDDDTDNGDDDTDSDENNEWDADWYDGLIKSYSNKTGQFTIVFVGEEHVFYTMKLNPNIVRPLVKKKSKEKGDDDSTTMDKDDEQCRSCSSNDDKSSLAEEQGSEFDDEDQCGSEFNDEDDDDYNAKDEVVVLKEKQQTMKFSNKKDPKGNETAFVPPNNQNEQEQQNQPCSSNSKKRKHDKEQVVNDNDIMNVKIKKKKQKREQRMKAIKRINRAKAAIASNNSPKEIIFNSNDHATAQKQPQYCQLPGNDHAMKKEVLPMHEDVQQNEPKSSGIDNAVVQKTRADHRHTGDVHHQMPSKPNHNSKKRSQPASQRSLLGRTLGLISNEQGKMMKQEGDFGVENGERRSTPSSHLQFATTERQSSSSTKRKKKKRQSARKTSFFASYCNNIKTEGDTTTATSVDCHTNMQDTGMVYCPPQGAIPQCTVSKAESSMIMEESKVNSYNNRMLESKQRRITTPHNSLKVDEVKSILSKEPKYSIIKKNNCSSNKVNVNSEQMNNPKKIIAKRNLLSSLCANMMRKVKFAEHLNETRNYVSEEIHNTPKMEDASYERAENQEKGFIIDKFIKKKKNKELDENQLVEPNKSSPFSTHEEEEERRKKRLLAYAAVSGTMDEMIACLHNGASARGRKGVKPLDKVKEAKTKLQKELEQYEKRDTLMNDISKLTNKVCRKMAVLDSMWKKNKCDRESYIRTRQQLFSLECKVQNMGRGIGLFFQIDPSKSEFLIADTQATKIKGDVLKLRLEELQRKYNVLKIFKEVEVIADIARSLHPKLHKNIDRSQDTFKRMRKDCAKRIKIVCDWIKRFHLDHSPPGTDSNYSAINVNISQCGGSSFTMLHAAACVFAINSINNLLDLGAQTTIKSDEFGTAVELAEDLHMEAKSRGDRKYEHAYKDVIHYLQKKGKTNSRHE